MAIEKTWLSGCTKMESAGNPGFRKFRAASLQQRSLTSHGGLALA
jgi:hypothetical protein